MGTLGCFVEFLSIDVTPSPDYAQTVGILHLVASAYLLLTLVLYVSTWKMAWILLLRALFAGFITLMMINALMKGLEVLN